MEPGARLANYTLVERIGAGGMGVVWKARDTNLDREVAIKLLTVEFSSDANRLARFEREAKLLASINHPNIATVYGLHEHDGSRFLAMELIPGQDLARKLGDAALPLGEALSIARQIAAALEATHERDVIHRDLKPANVYVTPAGEVKVLDFGIARDVGPEDALDRAAPEATMPGTILGTVSYMSPEQARGKSLDARADIWSFGCVLFRMLSGKDAFGGETRWDRLAAVLREEPAWDQLPAETPDAVKELIRRCLEKDPARRLANAGEAKRAIEAISGVVTGGGDMLAVTGAGPAAPDVPHARWKWIAGAALLVVVAAVLGWGLSRIGGEPDDSRRSIAVLPFESVSGGDENDAFTAGIHDDILNRLANIGGLKVISRTSVMEYKNTSKNLRQIADELGVAAVLEGSVRRAGDQVRITVQLVDADTDENLWADQFDRELSVEELFAIQSEIAERIATALEATLSQDERARIGTPPTQNLEAYDLYLQGLELLNRPGQLEENLLPARRRFEQATALDPSFALAYAGLSRAARLHYWLGGGTREALETAVDAAERAVAIAPELPEAHFALGTCFYVQHDYERALEELRIAEQGLPGSSELIKAKAFILRRRGFWDEALRDLRRAQALDPRDSESAYEVGFTLLNLRRYDEAEEYFSRALKLAPEYPAATIFGAFVPLLRDGTEQAARELVDRIDSLPPIQWKYAHRWQGAICLRDYLDATKFISDRVTGQWYDYPKALLIGWTYLLDGREKSAARYLDAARALLEADVGERPDDARLAGALGLTYAGLGRTEDALREGRRAVELMPVETDSFLGAWQIQDLAWIYVMTGEHDLAVEALDRLLSMPSVWSVEFLLLDPRTDPLRGQPGFERLVDKHRRR